jgi:hypothetical protein
MAKAMEGINVDADIQEFVTEHSSERPRDPPIEFMSYQGTHPSYVDLGLNSPTPTIPHSNPTPTPEK